MCHTVLKQELLCAFIPCRKVCWASTYLICAGTHATLRTQSIASLKSELTKYNKQHPTLQEALENAKQSCRVKALLTFEKHEVEEQIRKAQEHSSELPLLKTIFLAHRAVVENSDAITKAEKLLAQNHQEMRKQNKSIASLKAERMRELDKVLMVIQMLWHSTHTWLENHVCLNFAELCADRKQSNRVESCPNRAD